MPFCLGMDNKELIKFWALDLVGPYVLQEMDDEQSPPLRRKEATIILKFK